MKRWIAGVTTVCSVMMASPVAWAGVCHRPDGAAAYGPASTYTCESSTSTAERPASHLDIRSSVQVSRDVLKDAWEASRDAYTKKLEKYAKCPIGDAKKAVSNAHPGMKIESIQLRNIRTSLVYVAFAEDDEDRYLVIVDAGDGKVLLDKPLPTHHERVFAEH